MDRPDHHQRQFFMPPLVQQKQLFVPTMMAGGAEGGTGRAGERKRRFTEEQIRSLESMFHAHHAKLEPREKAVLARELGLQPRQVAIWFQNKRARWRSKQLEHDYAALKSKYDALHARVESFNQEKLALTAQLHELSETGGPSTQQRRRAGGGQQQQQLQRQWRRGRRQEERPGRVRRHGAARELRARRGVRDAGGRLRRLRVRRPPRRLRPRVPRLLLRCHARALGAMAAPRVECGRLKRTTLVHRLLVRAWCHGARSPWMDGSMVVNDEWGMVISRSGMRRDCNEQNLWRQSPNGIRVLHAAKRYNTCII